MRISKRNKFSMTGERSAVLLKLGRETAKRLTPYAEYKEVGAYLGECEQMAHYRTMIALGKLVYRLKKAVTEQT